MEQSPSLSLKRQFYKEGREGTKMRIRETKTNKKKWNNIRAHNDNDKLQTYTADKNTG